MEQFEGNRPDIAADTFSKDWILAKRLEQTDYQDVLEATPASLQSIEESISAPPELLVVTV